MNVVFAFNIFIASMVSIFGIVTPRVLKYFGLQGEPITTMVSPWFTFIALLIITLAIFGKWIFMKRNIMSAILLIIAVGGAFLLTFYFCNMTLPWG